MFAWAALLVAIELVGQVLAEHVRDGTPWHPHHIAERYGLMVIIALGEGLLGTTGALGVLIKESGWTVETALFGAIDALGAGLHAAAYLLEDKCALSETQTLVAVALPLSVYLLGLYVLYAALTRTIDPFHLLLIAVTAVVLVAALALSSAGVSLTVTLLVLAPAAWVTVVGYETVGPRHSAVVLAALPER